MHTYPEWCISWFLTAAQPLSLEIPASSLCILSSHWPCRVPEHQGLGPKWTHLYPNSISCCGGSEEVKMASSAWLSGKHRALLRLVVACSAVSHFSALHWLGSHYCFFSKVNMRRGVRLCPSSIRPPTCVLFSRPVSYGKVRFSILVLSLKIIFLTLRISWVAHYQPTIDTCRVPIIVDLCRMINVPGTMMLHPELIFSTTLQESI